MLNIGASNSGKSEAMRQLIAAVYDGEPPYEAKDLEAAGKEYRHRLTDLCGALEARHAIFFAAKGQSPRKGPK